jgi:hypothetical protein
MTHSRVDDPAKHAMSWRGPLASRLGWLYLALGIVIPSWTLCSSSIRGGL